MRLILTILLAAALALAQQAYKGKQETLPQTVAPQPVRFNHQLHTSKGVKCLDCHPGANTQERATLPQADQCMLCHQSIATDNEQIKKLAEIQKNKEPIQWVRVYEVPDFVFFSHVNHTKAGLACDTCHGPVETREVLAKEVSTSMTNCMNCHAAKQVDNHCHFCHSLGQ